MTGMRSLTKEKLLAAEEGLVEPYEFSNAKPKKKSNVCKKFVRFISLILYVELILLGHWVLYTMWKNYQSASVENNPVGEQAFLTRLMSNYKQPLDEPEQALRDLKFVTNLLTDMDQKLEEKLKSLRENRMKLHPDLENDSSEEDNDAREDDSTSAAFLSLTAAKSVSAGASQDVNVKSTICGTHPEEISSAKDNAENQFHSDNTSSQANAEQPTEVSDNEDSGSPDHVNPDSIEASASKFEDSSRENYEKCRIIKNGDFRMIVCGSGTSVEDYIDSARINQADHFHDFVDDEDPLSRSFAPTASIDENSRQLESSEEHWVKGYSNLDEVHTKSELDDTSASVDRSVENKDTDESNEQKKESIPSSSLEAGSFGSLADVSDDMELSDLKPIDTDDQSTETVSSEDNISVGGHILSLFLPLVTESLKGVTLSESDGSQEKVVFNSTENTPERETDLPIEIDSNHSENSEDEEEGRFSIEFSAHLPKLSHFIDPGFYVDEDSTESFGTVNPKSEIDLFYPERSPEELDEDFQFDKFKLPRDSMSPRHNSEESYSHPWEQAQGIMDSEEAPTPETADNNYFMKFRNPRFSRFIDHGSDEDALDTSNKRI